MFTGLPKDVITNTFHFIDFVPQPLTDLADDVTPMIDTMYTQIYGTGSRAANYVNWVGAEVNWYDLSQPQPRAPYTLSMPITVTAANTTIPTEVSMVSSFQAPRASGIPQSRRRGRVYLGGLGSGFIQASTGSAYPTFSSAALVIVRDAFHDFHTAVAGTSARWAVWSPTDQAAYTISNGWVEDSPDTQRRRGVTSQVRTAWS